MAAAQVHQSFRNGVDDAEGAARPGKNTRQAHHHQDDRGGFSGLDQQLVERAQGEGAIDDEPDEQPEDHGHHRGLGRGEPARAQAAQDEDRRGESPGGVLERGPQLRFGPVAQAAAEVVTDAEEERRDDEHPAGQDTRDDAAREQRRHGGRGHEHAVDDEGNRWRDQDIGRPGGRRDGSREARRVAGAQHGVEHDAAHGGRAGRARAGNAADDHGHQDGDHRQRAPAAADDRLRKPQQPPGDTGLVEDGPGQDEHRDGQERVLGNTGIDVGRNGHDAEVRERDDERSRQAQGGGDGHPQEHQKEEAAEENISRMDHFSPLQILIRTPTARPKIARERSGSHMV